MIVLEAVRNDGLALWYASEELHKDREIVLKAVKKHGFALKFASTNLQNDSKIVLKKVGRVMVRLFSMYQRISGMTENSSSRP